MIAVIQRIEKGNVIADGEQAGRADKGLFVLVGVGSEDDESDALVIADKVSKMRIFSDENDKMNLSVNDVGGSVLIVSNFTLFADCRKGNRPDFFAAAAPKRANELYEHFVSLMKERTSRVETGVFGAHMDITLSLTGPITIVLDSKKLTKGKVTK